MNRANADAAGQGSGEGPPKVTREIAAEAALWVARLHGPDRDAEMEREFRIWQARSPAHREAFEKCTDVWQDVSRIKVTDAYGAMASTRDPHVSRRSERPLWRWAAVAGLAFALVGGASLFQRWRDEGSYTTSVGEQRLVVLQDGTRMLLNTDTQVRVAFKPEQRNVEVGSGEALFEVAKDASRPFVVRVSGSEVVAVGTAFAVRYIDRSKDPDKNELAVTLLEGQVNVRPMSDGGTAGLAPVQPVRLRPGDRLQLDHDLHAQGGKSAATLDRPNVEQVMAWRRREAVFEEASLADAVDEMNRYNRTPLVLLGGLRAAKLHVSGVFRTGDTAGFARAVAALHGLTLRERDGRLELSNVH